MGARESGPGSARRFGEIRKLCTHAHEAASPFAAPQPSNRAPGLALVRPLLSLVLSVVRATLRALSRARARARAAAAAPVPVERKGVGAEAGVAAPARA